MWYGKQSAKIHETGNRNINHKVPDSASIPDSMKRNFPLVIKSPKSTGSKDVFKVTSEKQSGDIQTHLNLYTGS
jgi:glutathione synthase/RimK-type ligase-like ATP-grasp enzyme